jgi:N-acetylmuramoyl-L-alanine amidase
MIKGPDVYYYQSSQRGKAAAEIFANNLELIYPDPSLVTVVPTISLVEVRKTNAPAVLVELAYHDNWDDANWIISNIEVIARNLSLSVADYLGVPFVEP